MALTQAKARQMLEDPDSTPAILLAGAVGVFGSDFVSWDPETIAKELSRENIEIPPAKRNQLTAAAQLVSSDQFWSGVFDYITLVNALSSGRILLDVFDPATTLETCQAISDALLIWPHRPVEDFSINIINYIDATRLWEGVYMPPKFLMNCFNFATREDIFQSWSDDPQMVSAVYQKVIETADELDLEVQTRVKRTVDVAMKHGADDIADMASGLYAAATSDPSSGMFEKWLRSVS